MQSLPHQYRVDASANAEGPIAISSKGLETLPSAAPPEYGGPGDLWSPETLLVAAVVDCFILTFRAIARASSVEWIDLRCEGNGELDRIDQTTRFTAMNLQPLLTIPTGMDSDKAERLLHKAERTCLITNSLTCPVKLDTRVVDRQ